jgi:hypothetical protein
VAVGVGLGGRSGEGDGVGEGVGGGGVRRAGWSRGGLDGGVITRGPTVGEAVGDGDAVAGVRATALGAGTRRITAPGVTGWIGTAPAASANTAMSMAMTRPMPTPIVVCAVDEGTASSAPRTDILLPAALRTPHGACRRRW